MRAASRASGGAEGGELGQGRALLKGEGAAAAQRACVRACPSVARDGAARRLRAAAGCSRLGLLPLACRVRACRRVLLRLARRHTDPSARVRARVQYELDNKWFDGRLIRLTRELKNAPAQKAWRAE